MKRRMIWIGDAVIESGFSRCTHEILKTLSESWDVFVLGINYNGDPHNLPYEVYPCVAGGDFFGINRVVKLIGDLNPDIVFVQNDPWNIPGYLNVAGNVPVVASMPVDGKNCRGLGLNGLALGIFWTEFGMKEARAGGYTGPATVIPLGVDLEIYKQKDRAKARLIMGLPERLEKAFIVGNVNRNQPRKRLDLTVSYFAEWIREYNIRDAYLFLHVAPTGDQGYDVSQLMQYHGLANRLIISEPDVGFGIKQNFLAETYSAFDVQLSTSQGEGWGLTTMEGMACGIPQIVPDWAALGEWARDAAYFVDCLTQAVTPNKINVIGGIPDKVGTIRALMDLYQDPELRKTHSKKGIELVGRDEYRWSAIGKEFQEVIEKILYPHFVKGLEHELKDVSPSIRKQLECIGENVNG